MLRSVGRCLQRSACRLAPRTAVATIPMRTFAAVSGGNQIAALSAENPNVDVVRYTHKSRTWTTQHVQYYSEALAIGFLEMGFKSGDVVLSWLPEHFSETMVLQFACSKAGMVLYNLDPALATTDPAKAEKALAAALTLTKANILVQQEAGSDVNYINLTKRVVPELRVFDTSSGMPFVTPRFPDLRVCVHTGFDQDDKEGFFPLRHMVVPSENLDSYVDSSTITADTPLAGEIDVKDGMPVGTKVHSHAAVMKTKFWPSYASILNKEFHQVEGTGVIF